MGLEQSSLQCSSWPFFTLHSAGLSYMPVLEISVQSIDWKFEKSDLQSSLITLQSRCPNSCRPPSTRTHAHTRTNTHAHIQTCMHRLQALRPDVLLPCLRYKLVGFYIKVTLNTLKLPGCARTYLVLSFLLLFESGNFCLILEQ